MLTLITPTGGRQDAFSLCEKFMARQTYRGDVQWIVVDDCDPATVMTGGQTVIRPEPFWKPGDNTQGRNMLAALEQAHGDLILVIEDDDWYSQEYLRRMVQEADKTKAQIIGESHAIYYDVAHPGYRRMSNANHASLCQTAFRPETVPLLKEIFRTSARFYDLEMWKRIGKRHLFSLSLPLCVGIKGIPGRPGIGCGHKPASKWYTSDAHRVKLRSLIGADADLYARFEV